MKHLRKWAFALAAFSLTVALLAGTPAKASESIEDPQEDAAASGETATEEGTASAGAEEEEPEARDVMTTVTGTPDPDGVETTGADGTSAEPTAEETTDGETSGGQSAEDAGELETPAEPATDGNASEEDEAAADGETPVEEETASSGVKEEEAEGVDVTDDGSPLPFADVAKDHWSFPYVLYAYEHNLVRGVSETLFNPTGVMTRAAFVTALYRFSQTIGADMSAGEASFADIGDINEEFQAAVRWGAAHGIVTGRDEATFAPRENVSRQQMCAILARYLRDYLRYDLSAYAGAALFADGDTISAYAKEDVSIMQNMGIVGGREVDGVMIFDPAGSASRAAVVKVLSLAVQRIPDLQKLPEAPEEPGELETPEAANPASDNADETAKTDEDEKSSSGKSSGSSGSSGKSSGSSSGGSSSGGGSSSSGGSSSGGSSSGGNTTPIVTPPTEPENAAEIFGYIDELIAAYEANPAPNDAAKSFMDILIPDLKAMKEARAAGAIVDAAYFKAHYSQDLQKLLEKYNATTIEETLRLAEYGKSLVTSTGKLKKIAEYFGLSELLLG